jgi:hypothetical protein
MGLKSLSGPGRCSWLAPAHPPGATRRLERSTTGRSSGISLRLEPNTSPVAPYGSAGDARLGPVIVLPLACPLPARSARLPEPRCRTRTGLQFPSTFASGGSSGPVARTFVTLLRTRLPVSRPVALDAVHANPVNRAIAWRRLSLVVVAVGVLPRPWSRVPLRPRSPVARRLGASELASRSDRNRFRLVVWGRFPLPSAARLPVQSSFCRLGLSAPVGMRSPVRVIHSRTENPRSSGIFEST